MCLSIKIANRFKPFSHKYGTKATLPLSSYSLEAFPSFIRVSKEEEAVLEINFSIKAPVLSFTVMQDIEKAKLYIYGVGGDGYFRFSFWHSNENLHLKLERSHFEITYAIQKIEKLSFCSELEGVLNVKDELLFATSEKALSLETLERLSFGSHKKQDMALIQRRNDPKEYLPLWFALGQRMKGAKPQNVSKVPIEMLKRDFEMSYCDLFAKSNLELKHLGISTDKQPISLYEGYEFIRALLVYEESGVYHILKQMPHMFDCGRVCDLKLEEGIFIDLEWSKKSIKKLHIKSSRKTSILLSFHKTLKACRETSVSLVKRTRVLEEDILVSLKTGKTVFDRFQK